MTERLEYIRGRLKNTKLSYCTYNSKSKYLYDVDDTAEEDMLSLISGVEKLRDTGARG